MIYIYYDKETKIYKSSEFSDKKSKHPNCDCLEVEDKDWKDFINTYPEVIKVTDGKLTAHKKIRTLEELKSQKIASRKAYRTQMCEEWFDDIPNMSQEIKTKLENEKSEIDEIANATEETINNY